MSERVPVVTIDGPAGAGKGTIASLLAGQFSWHLLDSGAIYRAAALEMLKQCIPLDDSQLIQKTLGNMDVCFVDGKVLSGGEDVSLAIRTPECADMTSKIAAVPAVRAALLERQRAFAVSPGLVADGRDMGTVVFPDAKLKIFLTASPEIRGERRFKQLSEQGISANLATLIDEIAARDERDAGRAVAPLRAADDAVAIDSSRMTPQEVLEMIGSYL